MIKIIFELGINLIETLIIIDFVTRYLGCKYDGVLKNAGFIGAWLVSFIELSVINYIFSFEGVAVLIPVAINFIYALIFLRGSIPQKLWTSALIEIVMLIIAVGTNLFVCYVIGYDPNNMLTVFNSTRVISVIITKILLFYSSRVILRYKYKNPLDSKVWIMLIIIPIISVVSLSALMMAVMNYEGIKGYILCGMSGILIANIITYYFFIMLNKDYETRLKVKLLEQQNENTKRSIEDADAFIKQMRVVRHDIKNQLLIIYNYIAAGKNAEAEDYIKQLTNNYLPNMQNIITTDNEAFDAIINAKIAICNQKKIYIEVKEFKNSLKGLNAVDTGVLFGNLLDNAIEAADKTERRRITVEIQSVKGYLSIMVTNSISKSVLAGNKQLKTSKDDKELHGIGIKTIKEIIRKYNGIIDFFEDSGEFCCHILLDEEQVKA